MALLAVSLAVGAVATAGSGHAPGGSLRVGGDASYPPYHFIDVHGRAGGFDVELARGVAADLGLDPVFELGEWDVALERLARGELDVVPMFWSAEREQRYGLTEPILLRHHALFGHYETPTVASLEGLTDVRVAVQQSGLAWEAMRELAKPGVTLVAIDNEAQTLAMVARGEADYALTPTGIGYYAIQHSGLRDMVALSPPLLERKYVFAVRPGAPGLVASINGSLDRLRTSGALNRMYVEWLGNPAAGGTRREEATRFARALPATLAALAVALLAGIALFAWRRRTRRASPAAARRHVASTVPGDDDPLILAELRAAIAGQTLDFALQPKVELRSGRVVGAELLVRWQHPRLGALEPDHFVPIIERMQAIGEMTLYLVRNGLARCRDWPDTGDPLHVSINVSANDLADRNLVDAIIEASGGSGHCLMLEITETEVMREPERVAEALPRLRRHGIGISVDDFGVGHSSLVNLRRLAPEELKIDRSFVHALLASRSDRAIVRATIDLGHELGASIAAEGIENEATRRWLLEAGCDVGQGFGIARPMSPAEFMALLRSQP
ncbi:EAL domain-containing protein [Luteimonas sp. MJ246]|uniref:EAL domain-containing protein n=1 Tax=Luteimonas sp. MJ174 TaxID=3129237 RepID=UPI0031BA90D8